MSALTLEQIIAVKPLEWDAFGRAFSVIGTYEVICIAQGGVFGLVLPGDSGNTFPTSKEGSEEDCRAAAQAHFTAAVLSAIDRAILSAFTEATSRAEKLEHDLASTNAALSLCGYGADTHAAILAALEAVKKMSRDNRTRAETAERKLAEAVEARDRVIEALTPSACTKVAYIGEFKFAIERTDKDGDVYGDEITVPWTTVKKIMAAIRARAITGDQT